MFDWLGRSRSGWLGSREVNPRFRERFRGKNPRTLALMCDCFVLVGFWGFGTPYLGSKTNQRRLRRIGKTQNSRYRLLLAVIGCVLGQRAETSHTPHDDGCLGTRHPLGGDLPLPDDAHD